jgi:hypothetical protein
LPDNYADPHLFPLVFQAEGAPVQVQPLDEMLLKRVFDVLPVGQPVPDVG